MDKVDKYPRNQELEPLSFLIGNWKVEMKHTAIPEPLTWEDSFEWFEDAFIIWHWQGKNEVPKATFIIGRNENKSDNIYSMLYYDARGVSRMLEMSLVKNIWKFWREGSDFYQRFKGEINDARNIITGIGEMSHDKGSTWKYDFSISYTKIV
jgi:hypothetical protein